MKLTLPRITASSTPYNPWWATISIRKRMYTLRSGSPISATKANKCLPFVGCSFTRGRMKLRSIHRRANQYLNSLPNNFEHLPLLIGIRINDNAATSLRSRISLSRREMDRARVKPTMKGNTWLLHYFSEKTDYLYNNDRNLCYEGNVETRERGGKKNEKNYILKFVHVSCDYSRDSLELLGITLEFLGVIRTSSARDL